jgi:hypothetical protein
LRSGDLVGITESSFSFLSSSHSSAFKVSQHACLLSNLFCSKDVEIGTTTFTGLYDPALNDHLGRSLTLCIRRRNRTVVCNLPILSLDYFDGSFHNNTGAHFEKCLLEFVGNACTDKRNVMNERDTLICGARETHWLISSIRHGDITTPVTS